MSAEGIGVRRYLDADAAAEYLGMPSAEAVRRAAQRRLLPYCKVGRKLVFDRAKLDAWMESLENVSVDEAAARKINGGTVAPLPE